MAERNFGVSGLGWVGLGWIGLGWVGLGWVVLGWAGLGWVGLVLTCLPPINARPADDGYKHQV